MPDYVKSRDCGDGKRGHRVLAYILFVDAAVGDFHQGFGASASFKIMEDQYYAWLDFSSHLFMNGLGCRGRPRQFVMTDLICNHHRPLEPGEEGTRGK